jgi:aminotransferase in exopolysaccharide biosynthesis
MSELKSNVFVESLIKSLKNILGENSVALHEPKFNGNEWLYLKDCLDSGFVSSVGKYVDLFEEKLADFCGAKHAIAVVNGTAALHICLKIAGVGYKDEVLTPALSFVASANAVVYCGATPHFVDSEHSTLGIDPNKLRVYLKESTKIESGRCINIKTGNIIKALIPMHVFGHPVDLDNILEVGREFNITIIEDAAESIGSFYHGRHTGTFGLMGALSFNGNKTITTGGGGAILTNDSTLAAYAKHLTTTAKKNHPWIYYHDEIGFNYRMPNINAALGCAQIEQLNEILNLKKMIFNLYKKEFQGMPNVTLFEAPKNTLSNYWLNALILSGDKIMLRDEVIEKANNLGIMLRPTWIPLNRLPSFKNCPSMETKVADAIHMSLINIPSGPALINI